MKKLILFILICCLAASFATAQDSTIKAKKRYQKSFLSQDRPWTVELPVWIPGFRGNFSYGDIDLEGEDGGDPGDPGDPGDGDNCGILCRVFNSKTYLKFYVMTRVSYNRNKFIAQFDGFSAAFGESIKFNYNDKEIVQVNVRAVLLRIYGGYSIIERTSGSQKFKFNLYGYGGAKFHGIQISSDLNGAINKLDINPTWAEPILGLKTRFAMKKWLFTLQGDVGGFYINKKLSYMINMLASYRINRLLSVKLGWNIWDIDYKKTIKDEDLKLKIHLAGPSAALTFHF